MYLSNSVIPACYLLTLKHPLRAVTDALNLFVSVLHHLFHLLLRLLKIIWQHGAVELKVPQPLVVVLSLLLYIFVCALRGFNGFRHGHAT